MIMKPEFIKQLSQLDDNDTTQKRTIPPLEKWQPATCGNMDLVIKANGEWYHEGQKMTRQSMIDLFAKVLWVEIDEKNIAHYFLKTPVEKIGISVEDAPLQIISVTQIVENGLTFIQFCTSQCDKFVLDDFHEIRFGLPFKNADTAQTSVEKQQSQPYVLVRKNADSSLYALILRSVFYHLVDMGELVETSDSVGLWLTSGEKRFFLAMSVV